MEIVPQLSADDYEWRHPAEMMAEGSFSHQERRQYDQHDQNDEIGDKGLHIAYGKAVGGLIQEIYLPVTAGPCRKYCYCGDPRYPDQPFDDIAFSDAGVPYLKECFLAAGSRAGPTAVGPSQEQGTDKQKDKKNEAAVNYAFGACFEDENRGKVIKRRGEQEE